MPRQSKDSVNCSSMIVLLLSIIIIISQCSSTTAARQIKSDTIVKAPATLVPSSKASQKATDSPKVQITSTKPSLSDNQNDKNSNLAESPSYHLDGKTRLIYVHKHNEAGYLVGEFGLDKDSPKSQLTVSQLSTSPGPRKKENRQKETNRRNSLLSAKDHLQTNYTVYLISRSKKHIAVAIDFEEVAFDPVINCENQEIKFSIIGEINRKSMTDYVDDVDSDEDDDDDDEKEPAAKETEMSASDESASIPSAETMSIIMNSPLNKTILNEEIIGNDFRIIDTMIDLLHQEACLESKMSKEASSPAEIPNEFRRPNRRRVRGIWGENTRTKKKMIGDPLNCNHMAKDGDDSEFKSLMATALEDHFSWDEFKVVCGKTKRLIIPMKAIKINVFGDEFSQKSKFKLRYQFISDPKLLPSYDNNKFYCRNRNVIDLSMKCDGYDDCQDGSDESTKTCGYPTNRYKKHSNHKTRSSASTKQGNTKVRLTYVTGVDGVINCCRSSDWLEYVTRLSKNNRNLDSQFSASFQSISSSIGMLSDQLYALAKEDGTVTARRRVKRIVGGNVAPVGAFPAQVSLQYESIEPLSQFCAGTLIHPQYVLTAGHCITKDSLIRGIKVVFGIHDLRKSTGNNVQVRYVEDGLVYPGVNVKLLPYEFENDMNNDLAILRLNAPILITEYVQPACLPPQNTPLPINASCRSIGWGQTHGSGSSNLLKHLPLKVVEDSLCLKELIDRDNDQGDKDSDNQKNLEASIAAYVDQYNNETMICVNNDSNHSICQGDSGGPLYCERESESGQKCDEIYGVASFIIQYSTIGAMCAVENLPGIFGEISMKTEWIVSTIKMFEQTYKLKYSH